MLSFFFLGKVRELIGVLVFFAWSSIHSLSGTWSQPVSEPTYSLGDLINIQASVKESNHVPLKIYVDECVARPSAEASVKYEVITNHG